MTVIVLAQTRGEEVERYGAVMASIGDDLSRFSEIGDADLAFCIEHDHWKLVCLTRQMMEIEPDDERREVAIRRCLAVNAETLERLTTLALLRAQAGEMPTLGEFAAMWVTACAIKNRLTVEQERRGAGRMN